MISKSNLKDYIGILYYRHGLFCASNPVTCLLLVFSVVFLSCYPLRNITSFGSSLEQYKQPIVNFDGLEANSEINEFIEYDRLADRPTWYNRIPIAYIQRIVVKSIITIPPEIDLENESNDPNKPHKQKRKKSIKNSEASNVYLIDVFRTPLGQLFELNEFIRNFRTENHSSNIQQSLMTDMCVHVGELAAHQDTSSKREKEKRFNKHYLPEFNCLYLSPTNFWSNDLNKFLSDEDIMHTINDSPMYLKNLNINTNMNEQSDKQEEEIEKDSSIISSIWNRIIGRKSAKKTNIRELLFGVTWPSTVTPLEDNPKLSKKFIQKLNQSNSKSIIFTYAITIALKKYDKSFLDELKYKLDQKFHLNMQFETDESLSDNSANIVNLQYTSQSFVYYIPYASLYILLFLYIYISVRKIEFVKSKWGLALAAVCQVIASLLMSIGICSFFGLTPTLNGGEIFPYLIIFIGFENIVVLTKSVVSTPFDLDVRYRIALGLKKESWLITKIITSELIIIFFGILTMVPAIQEFCVFAYVGLLIDFFMQMIFFVTVLSIDIRRMELSDLNKHPTKPVANISQNKSNDSASDGFNKIMEAYPINFQLGGRDDSNLTYRQKSGVSSAVSPHESKKRFDKDRLEDTEKWVLMGKKYNTFLMNKMVQFFYFWARTRMVQRAIIFLSCLWIILIFYKSLLVVELMRHDVNVKKETVEALLPKGVGLPKLIKDNFQQFLFTPSPNKLTTSSEVQSNIPDPLSGTYSTSTIDYLKEQFKNIVNYKQPKLQTSTSYPDYMSSTTPPQSFNSENQDSLHKSEQNWKTLDYYHWLTLFANYNVSLYNRYVAILPQINLYTQVKYKDILKFRNKNEISNKKYNLILKIDNRSRFSLDDNQNQSEMFNSTSDTYKGYQNITYKSALFELIWIVILGIPTIFLLVYCFILFYKCLCSKNYEEWRKTWSTSNIKKQYKIIHSKINKFNDSDIENEDDKNEKYSDALSTTTSSDEESETLKEDGNIEKPVSKDELINKIINGKKDDVDIEPYKQLNLSQRFGIGNKHEYQIDLISYGSYVCVTSDINNQVKIWPLADSIQIPNNFIDMNLINRTEKQDNFSLLISIWSICMSFCDRFLFIAQSDGKLRAFDLRNIQKMASYSAKDMGITHLFQYAFNNSSTSDASNTSSSLLLKSMTPNFDYLILILARLDGVFELVRFSFTNNQLEFILLSSLRVYNSPIIDVCYVDTGDYLITTSQDCSVKGVKIKSSKLSMWSSVSFVDEKINDHNEGLLSIVFSSNEHDGSAITAMCIDKLNCLNAATASNDGTLCVWNLFTGQCKLKLNAFANRKYKQNENECSIIKLEIVDNLLISLSSDQQICFWNRAHGKLIKEFKFIAPMSVSALNGYRIDTGDLNSTTDHCLNSASSSIANSIMSSIFGLVKNYSRSNKVANKKTTITSDDLGFKPLPTMCLYSKNILITGGCSCLFVWDIVKGELIKK